MRKGSFKIRLFKIKNVKRIHCFRKKEQDKEKQANKFDKGFNESLQFLSEYVSNNKKKKGKEKNLKKQNHNYKSLLTCQTI